MSTANKRRIRHARKRSAGDGELSRVVDIATQRYRGSRDLFFLLGQSHNKECLIERDRIFSLLSLCEEGPRIDVDYAISDLRLLCRVLKASANSICLCSASIGARALDVTALLREGSRAESLLREDFLGFDTKSGSPYGRPLSLQSSASFMCKDCFFVLDSSWIGQRSIMFCLYSICWATHGHLFWEQPSPSKREETVTNTGRIYYVIPSDQGQLRMSLDLRRMSLGQMGERVEIAPSGDGESYTIRLTCRHYSNCR